MKAHANIGLCREKSATYNVRVIADIAVNSTSPRNPGDEFFFCSTPERGTERTRCGELRSEGKIRHAPEEGYAKGTGLFNVMRERGCFGTCEGSESRGRKMYLCDFRWTVSAER